MNVEVVCTTDDPIDTLEHHQALANQELGFIVLPAFRPDKAIFIDTDNFNSYIERLQGCTNYIFAFLKCQAQLTFLLFRRHLLTNIFKTLKNN